jgi:RsiW-degrading membrane proteinase PrsW (M82 family)
MQYFIYLSPVILPALFWAGYHYYKDRHLPEPLSHLFLAFTLGVGSFYLGGMLYRALGVFGLRYDAYLLAESNLPGFLAYAILAIGIIEELAKMIPFLLVVVRLPSFNEPIDGIIYASFIALGFAAMENIQYLQFLAPQEAWARGFAGPLIHIVFASVWGFYIGRAYLYKRDRARTTLVALLVTALLHGVYDSAVIARPESALPLAALLIVTVWIWRLRLIRNLHLAPPGPCPAEED